MLDSSSPPIISPPPRESVGARPVRVVDARRCKLSVWPGWKWLYRLLPPVQHPIARSHRWKIRTCRHISSGCEWSIGTLGCVVKLELGRCCRRHGWDLCMSGHGGKRGQVRVRRDAGARGTGSFCVSLARVRNRAVLCPALSSCVMVSSECECAARVWHLTVVGFSFSETKRLWGRAGMAIKRTHDVQEHFPAA